MQQAGEITRWRTNFLSALEFCAQAGARLPFGVPDPVLCGDSAVELYTGGLWSSADLEVICADARLLTAELFAVGFRRSERPRRAERGLWHPALQIGIDIIEARGTSRAAEQANRLVLVLDLEPTGQPDAASLMVVGIEDLIAQQVSGWRKDGAPSGELAARLQALVELGREGVGGPLGARYLQHRIARETNGEVIVEMFRQGEGRAQIRAPRTMGLTQMHRRISAWRDQCGLLSDPLHAIDPVNAGDTPTSLVRYQNGKRKRGGRPGLPSAEILPFDASVSLRPR